MSASCSLSWLVLVAPLGACLLFIGLIAATVMLLRPSKDGRGVGGCAGCAIALGLFVAFALGAVGCTALTVIGLASTAAEHGPVRSLELEWDEPEPDAWTPDAPQAPDAPDAPEPATPEGAASTPRDERFPVRLRVTLDGTLSPADVTRLTRFLRRRVEGDLMLSVDTREEAGGTVTSVELGLPVERDDLEQLQGELRDEMGELDLPRGLRIEIRKR